MEYKALRRACTLRESAGFLVLPLLYGVLMGVGALSYAPSLAFLTLGLVFMLVMQQRSSGAAATMAPRRRGQRGASWPSEQLDAADVRVLRQVAATAASNIAAYVVLIFSIDAHLRALADGRPPGLVLYVGAAVAVAAALAGRAAARRWAWAGFASSSPALWTSKEGLNVGRAARSTAAYLAWREGASPAD